MKLIFINFLLLFSITGLASKNDNFVADKLMTEIDGYGDEAFKAKLYASKSASDQDAIGLNLIMSAYFLNKNLKANQLMYPYKNLSFQDSINSEIKAPTNTSLEMITSIMGQCLYGSMKYKAVLETCSSDKFFNRVDELSEIYDTGGWATILQDLYSVASIIRDNKAEMLARFTKKSEMADAESIKDQSPGPESRSSEEPSAEVAKEAN